MNVLIYKNSKETWVKRSSLLWPREALKLKKQQMFCQKDQGYFRTLDNLWILFTAYYLFSEILGIIQ